MAAKKKAATPKSKTPGMGMEAGTKKHRMVKPPKVKKPY